MDPRNYRPAMARTQWRPSYPAPRVRSLAQATPGKGGTMRTIDAALDSALFGGIAYLGISTGLKEKGTTLSVVGWVVGVMGAAKGLLSLSRLFMMATEPAPVPAAPLPPAEGVQTPA